MRNIEREVDRYLTQLRNVIRQRGFTQLEVQEALGWGRSYISQIVTKQKSLRLEQVLLILNVIGLDPATFFAELYDLPHPGGSQPGPPRRTARRQVLPPPDHGEVKALLDAVVRLLTQKGILTASELAGAKKKARHQP